MKTATSRASLLFGIAAIVLVCTFLPQLSVDAAGSSGVTGSDIELIPDYEEAEDQTKLGTNSPAQIVGALISAFLGVLGLIAVVIIIFSGYTWMTAAGNKDKVEEAQDRIRNATIGLAIILASYSITLFVFSQLEGATCFGAQCDTPSGHNFEIETPMYTNDYA